MRRTRAVLLSAAAALVLAACGTASTSDDGDAADAPDAESTTSMAEDGMSDGDEMADDEMADDEPMDDESMADEEMSDDHDESMDDEMTDDASTPADTSDDGDGGTPANAAALDFTARGLLGGTVDGQDYAGEDVVLWMWTSWCPNCNAEAPGVRDAVERYGDQVTFIGVPGADDDDAGRMDFVEEHGLSGIPHAVDDDGSVWSQYGVGYQPAWIFIDEDGDVERVAGGLYDELDERVEALIAR